MSANVEGDGTVQQLDRRADPDENITEAAVKEPKKLAEFLLRLFREVALLRRRWSPKRIDFRDLVSTGTSGSPQKFRLDHKFGAPVVWWPVRHTSGGTVATPFIHETSESDDNTLVVNIYYAATVTLRVEEAG